MEASWEKPKAAVKVQAPNRIKFAVIGLVLLGAMIYMIVSGTTSGGKYFITVNDLITRSDLVGKNVKVSGAVLGETIKFDAATKTISFTMAHLTDSAADLEKEGGLAKALHLAVLDPTAQRLQVRVPNQAMPDLLQNEAQAIVTGKLGPDGVFVADELLLKCPSKYTADVPQQTGN
ncbi:MAG: cytochrome c maturation protein CcmE [Anaerolineae bacterium]|nr:cytochrome c maturation protein CcmE [Anaerolineae bacterium]